MQEALNEPVIVAGNGGRRKITMRDAIIRQFVKRSATADLRATKILLDLVRDIEGRSEEGHSEPGSAETGALTEVDRKVIEQLRARFANGER